MTWSIIALDPHSGQVGIAVTTCAFAVGARVPFIATGVGAVATQAFTNPYYGPKGIALLRQGLSAEQTLKRLTDEDDGRVQRQVHVMDKHHRFAAFTGDATVPWSGHLVRDTFSIAGNMLAGAMVIEESARAFAERSDLTLARRLIHALKAGQAAGGDKRGKQSAALLVHDDEDYSLVDLRVDDNSEPLDELERLEQVNGVRYAHYRKFQPSRANPAGITDRDELERLIAASIAAGHR